MGGGYFLNCSDSNEEPCIQGQSNHNSKFKNPSLCSLCGQEFFGRRAAGGFECRGVLAIHPCWRHQVIRRGLRDGRTHCSRGHSHRSRMGWPKVLGEEGGSNHRQSPEKTLAIVSEIVTRFGSQRNGRVQMRRSSPQRHAWAFAPVAQRIERPPSKRNVGGSIPPMSVGSSAQSMIVRKERSPGSHRATSAVKTHASWHSRPRSPESFARQLSTPRSVIQATRSRCFSHVFAASLPLVEAISRYRSPALRSATALCGLSLDCQKVAWGPSVYSGANPSRLKLALGIRRFFQAIGAYPHLRLGCLG